MGQLATSTQADLANRGVATTVRRRRGHRIATTQPLLAAVSVGIVAVALVVLVVGALGLITRAEDPTGQLVGYLALSGGFWAVAFTSHARLSRRHRT